MNKKLNILLAILMIALIGIGTTSATPQYLTIFNAFYSGGSCSTCHVNGASGGYLNEYGIIFKQWADKENIAPVVTSTVTPIVNSDSQSSIVSMIQNYNYYHPTDYSKGCLRNAGFRYAYFKSLGKDVYLADIMNPKVGWYHTVAVWKNDKGQYNFFNYDNPNIIPGDYQMPVDSDITIRKNINLGYDQGEPTSYGGEIERVIIATHNEKLIAGSYASATPKPTPIYIKPTPVITPVRVVTPVTPVQAATTANTGCWNSYYGFGKCAGERGAEIGVGLIAGIGEGIYNVLSSL